MIAVGFSRELSPAANPFTEETMFYTYLWLREDRTPYYVGKGKGNRAYTSWGHGVRCPKEKECIVIYPAESEVDALETESALIWYYGRKDIGTGILRNLTDGGENPPNARGVKRSEETKARMRGRIRSPEEIQRCLASRRAGAGFAHTEEAKMKMSAAKKGKLNPAHNKGITGVHTWKRSEESKKKMCIAAKKRMANGVPEETRKKISESVKAAMTPELRQRLSIAAKNRKDRRPIA
jgi:hypothetical protein